MRKLLLSLGLFSLLLSASPGYAQLLQLRPLPAGGERGSLGEPQALPLVKIGRRVMPLAPGAVIYDQQNRSILHANLPANVDVLYTKDDAGRVQRIYILSEQERLQLSNRR